MWYQNTRRIFVFEYQKKQSQKFNPSSIDSQKRYYLAKSVEQSPEPWLLIAKVSILACGGKKMDADTYALELQRGNCWGSEQAFKR